MPVSNDIATAVQDWSRAQELPETYAEDVTRWLVPLLPGLVNQIRASARPWVLAINGAQGSGKSTLAGLLEHLLRHSYKLAVAQCSIDDLYATRQQRQHLAQRVHPLLATRGVPGTHELELWWQLLQAAAQPQALTLPRFSKADDDRLPVSAWPRVQGPLQVVILEGWCVACRPQPAAQLEEPINSLEREEDPQGIWRTFVNQQLQDTYARMAASIDTLIMLHAPDLDAVLRWRGQQEARLAAQQQGRGIMDAQQLRRFIEHFERLTRWQWQDLPQHADYRIILDDAQRMRDLIIR